MVPRIISRLSNGLIVLALLCAVRLAPAQEFDFTGSGFKVASLDGLWHFHPGDDPHWAAPDFDDSNWPLLHSDTGWYDQGYNDMNGYGWYRFSVTGLPDESDLSLALPVFYTSYQLFANGRLVGTYGRMPPDFIALRGGIGETFRLPPGVSVNGKLVIAIRVWHWPAFTKGYSGGPQSARSLLGETSAIEQDNSRFLAATLFQFTPAMLVALLEILAGVGAFLLFFQRRADREYLWFGILMFSGAAYGICVVIQDFIPIQEIISDPYRVALTFAIYPFAELYFYAWLLKARRNAWFRFVRACVLLNLVCAVACYFASSESAFPVIQVSMTLLSLPQYIWVLWLLISRAREDFMDAKWLLAPAVFQKLALIWNRFGATTFTIGWQHQTGLLTQIITHPVRVDLQQLANLIFLLGVFAILAFRFSRTCSREERFASEVEAARNVQQYLIPDHLPQTPGLVIDSAYRPSREVGGDFFQVLPNSADGSVLIAIGDVAGKGLQAGMLATLIVGAIRIAVQFTGEPGRILALLNQRLQGRGLVTCLVMRIDRDGTLQIANAGHLPPYLNGKEQALDGALPLGALPGVEYPTTRSLFQAGDSLVLMSDGVAEAQNAARQLFGFERIGEMLRLGTSAASLAAAAQAFGQDDDITVLTISRSAARASL